MEGWLFMLSETNTSVEERFQLLKRSYDMKLANAHWPKTPNRPGQFCVLAELQLQIESLKFTGYLGKSPPLSCSCVPSHWVLV